MVPRSTATRLGRPRYRCVPFGRECEREGFLSRRTARPFPAPRGIAPVDRRRGTHQWPPDRLLARPPSRCRRDRALLAPSNHQRAHLADDPGLIAAFREGRDVHNATAARVFGVDVGAVTHEQRSRAKMVSYGLAYGMEAYGLGQRLGIPTGEASAILDAYFAAFPNVQAYMERTVAEAKTRGYTETLFGRRRRIPELESGNFRVRQMGERQAMNAGIQGLAADIFKKALIGVDHALENQKLRSRIVLQVHDEIIVEVPEAEVEVAGPLCLGIMETATELNVPLAVNSAWGRTWAEAKG
ncbi:MAG: hypothetical protein EBZ93_02755 [Actinobacteria bacterium]|nr:hypothetical protein [Actinomycetota bacterium]